MISKEQLIQNISSPQSHLDYLNSQSFIQGPRFKLLLAINSRDQHSYFTQCETQINSPDQLKERNNMGKLKTRRGSSPFQSPIIMGKKKQSNNILTESILSQELEKSRWTVKLRQVDCHQVQKKSPILRAKFKKKRVESTPNLYDASSIQDQLKFRKMPCVVISNSIFDPEELKQIKLQKKQEILEAKKEELKIKRRLRFEYEEQLKKLKKPIDLRILIERELKLPALQRQGEFIQEFQGNSQQRLSKKVDLNYEGFPKDFERMIMRQKRKFKEIRNKIRYWDDQDPKERIEELKEQAREILNQKLYQKQNE